MPRQGSYCNYSDPRNRLSSRFGNNLDLIETLPFYGGTRSDFTPVRQSMRPKSVAFEPTVFSHRINQ